MVLQASFGIGAINFLFGLPAILLIDRVGRRKLLLWTFPFMAIFMAWVALASLAYKHATLLRGLTITGMVTNLRILLDHSKSS